MLGNAGEQDAKNTFMGFHWRFFERYLASIRPLRGADGRFPEAVLPPVHTWNGYFMSLSMCDLPLCSPLPGLAMPHLVG
jgi:hypothetical protein